MPRRRLLTAIIAALLIFFSMNFLHWPWLGAAAAVVYLIFISDSISRIFVRRFGFENSWRLKFLGALTSIFAVSALCGMFLIIWRLDALQICISMLLVGCLADYFSGKRLPYQAVWEEGNALVEMTNGKYYIITFLLVILFGFLTLAGTLSDAVVTSPWQVISSRYIYLFFLAILILGGIIFSKTKITAVIGMMILLFVITFAYLPLSHKLFWGADGWRHLASIEQILSDGKIAITNYAGSPNWVERLNPGVFAYSQFWSLIVIVEKTLNTDLVRLVAWLQPLLAGIFFPLLFYELALAIGFKRRESLVFAWLGPLPFAIQSAGSFSLPANLGFLFFLLFLNLILRRAKNPTRGQIPVLVIVGVLSFFGYLLFAILYFALWFTVEIFLRFKNKIENHKRTFAIIAAVCFALFIPVIELAAGYAKFNGWGAVFNGIKACIGNHSGYYLASGPRPHVIETGNVFFNQIPSYAFQPNALTQWRWWIVAIMVLIFVGAIWGAIKMLRDNDRTKNLVALFGIGIFAGQIICRYFLSADNILSRRLDAVVALTILIFLYAAIEKFFTKNLFVSILIVFVGSIAMAASYSLGPYSRVVSADEYKAAKFVWSETSGDAKHCVVGETYQLLALEAVSQKKIIGGGFPIDKNFGQAELMKMYSEITAVGRYVDLNNYRDQVLKLTGADSCYLITTEDKYLINSSSIKFGEVSIYKF